jgi:tRNA U34 5-carboxymethylaminomethyl modifying enzyme MnmG/GidA
LFAGQINGTTGYEKQLLRIDGWNNAHLKINELL